MPERAPLLLTEQGWKIRGVQAWVDPSFPVQTAIISHAHGDHAVAGHHRVYCTKDTARLLTVRYRKFAWEVITCDWNVPFEVDGIPFSFHPAGHMLGAAMISWDYQGEKILYTGDFHPAPNPTCDAFDVVPCDVLITETTFAQPGKRHPDPAEVLRQQLHIPDINYVIGAYVVGKAQHLNHLLTSVRPDLQVMIHPKIIPFHHAYRSAGFPPGEWVPFQRQQFKRNRNIVYIVGPQVLEQLPQVPYALRGFASGWLERQEGYDLLLPISDHADWFDLINTIEQSGAKMVYTLHGEGNQLRIHFDNKIPVLPLEL
jgi:putative mRNA 3-end processing factor